MLSLVQRSPWQPFLTSCPPLWLLQPQSVVVVWKDRAVCVPTHPARRVLAPEPIIALSEAVWEQIYDPGMVPGGAVLLMPSLHKSPSLDIRRKICRQIQGSDQAYPGVEQIAFTASSCWNLVTLSDL